jgi:hypothetical protein
VSVGAVPNDGGSGIDAWFVDDASNDLFTSRGYLFTTTTAQNDAGSATGWTLSTTLRVVTGSSGVFLGPLVNYRDGSRIWWMYFDTDGSGDPIVSSGPTGTSSDPSYTVAGGAGSYHTYSLVYDPVADSADLFVDGIERISDYVGVASGSRIVAWGSGGSNSSGRAHYASVTFSIVPEPSAALLLASALLALACERRRRRA